MIPDLIVSDGQQSYLVEVAVTHRVNHEKLLKIRELNLPTAELNISHLRYREEATADIELAVRDERNWTWVHHPLEQNLRAQAQVRADGRAAVANRQYREEARAEAEVAEANERIALLARQVSAEAKAEANKRAELARQEAASVKAEEDRLALLAWEAEAPARAEVSRIALLAHQMQMQMQDETGKRTAELDAALKTKKIAEYKALREQDAATQATETARRHEERDARRIKS